MQAGEGKATFLVTRPEIDQPQTIAALAAMDMGAMSCPVMDSVKRPFTLPDRNWQGVAVTSRNALRMLDERQLSLLRSLPLHCVGGRTEELARALGFSSLASVATDVEHLISHLQSILIPEDGTLLYLTGVHRSAALADRLGASGFEVESIETYEMVARCQLPEVVIKAIQERALAGVLLYSARTARLFLSLIRAYQLQNDLQDVRFYCLSEAIALVVKLAGFVAVAAEKPHEKALLACVKGDPVSGI